MVLVDAFRDDPSRVLASREAFVNRYVFYFACMIYFHVVVG